MQKLRINTMILSAVFILVISGTGFAYAQESVNQFYSPATEGLTTFANNVAESVPKIVAAVILLIIGLVAGKLVGRGVEKAATKILQKVDFQKNADSQILDLSSNKLNSAKLIAATIKWFVYIFFIVAAINALQFVELSTALTDLWLWIPNLLAFVLILIIGSIIIVKFVIKWVDQEIVSHGFGNARYVITGIKVVMYGIIFAVAITQLGIGESIIPILVSAFAWSIAVAIGAAIAVGLGFTLKDVLPAAIAGAANHRSIFKVGQKIKIGDVTGTITSVGTLHIIVTNDRNEGIVIPTKEFIGKSFTILPSN
ncbi:MAG: TM helix repeat-containing protein [Thaumarchaeota archaeon CSP1-1]|nr:MAG: TM helix repeat-containing protein [Thaumarchaeota archaeon CSP1-1]